MVYHYDHESDVLYIHCFSVRPGIYKEITEGVYLKRDIDTNKPVGILVINYCELFTKNNT